MCRWLTILVGHDVSQTHINTHTHTHITIKLDIHFVTPYRQTNTHLANQPLTQALWVHGPKTGTTKTCTHVVCAHVANPLLQHLWMLVSFSSKSGGQTNSVHKHTHTHTRTHNCIMCPQPARWKDWQICHIKLFLLALYKQQQPYSYCKTNVGMAS